jgi:asparagine synthase (glutamine-hydrolysing)
MCGIAGIVSLSGKSITDVELKAKKMIKHLDHRGPDSNGYYVTKDKKVLLVNTRLSIVDVKDNFQVPILSTNKPSVLTYNGEIFNHAAYKKEMKKRGVKFRTNSDTETFLELINTKGLEFLNDVDGFWGFGHLDLESGELTIGRDVFGKKHVFYYQDADYFVFSSEVNAILSVVNKNFSINQDSLVSCLRFRCPPQKETLVNDVHKLLPGEVIKINKGHIKSKVMWKFNPLQWLGFFKLRPSDDAIIEVFDEMISNSCRLRMPSEVNFMSSLSGGIDSSLICMTLSSLRKKPIRTIFAKSTRKVFDSSQDELDELTASQYSSDILKTNHHIFSMLNDSCVNDYYRSADNSFDGFLCEGLVSFYQLAREVRGQGAKVLMLSDGPDEYFTGYTRDIESIPFIEKQKGSFRFRTAHGGSKDDFLKSILSNEAYFECDSNSYGTIPVYYANEAKHLDACQKMALSYAARSMPDHYNLRTDRATMLSSVELRLPFQTRDLIEFSMALPKSMRINNANLGKKILRVQVENKLGKSISMRSKHGFASPAWWDKAMSERLMLKDYVQSSDIFDILPFKKSAKDAVLSPGNGRYIWMMFCLGRVNERLKKQDYMP